MRTRPSIEHSASSSIADRARRRRAWPVDRGSARPQGQLERGAGRGVVLRGDVEVERAALEQNGVDVQVDRCVGHGEDVEGGAQGPAGLLAGGLRGRGSRPARRGGRPARAARRGRCRSMASLPASRAKSFGRTRTRPHSRAGAPPSLDSTRTPVELERERPDAQGRGERGHDPLGLAGCAPTRARPSSRAHAERTISGCDERQECRPGQGPRRAAGRRSAPSRAGGGADARAARRRCGLAPGRAVSRCGSSS